MQNSNIPLEIINDIIEDSNTFVIDDDNKAEWALRKIVEEKTEAQRYINVCKNMIYEYEEKIRKLEGRLENKTFPLKTQLQHYFESVKHKKTKTQEAYKLPSGTLKLKYLQPEFKRNDDQLLHWLKSNNMNNFINIEEKPNWGEFKKSVLITDEKIVTEDGQIVEGVEVIQRPPIFEVDT